MSVDLSQAPTDEPDDLGDPEDRIEPTVDLEVRAPGSGRPKLVPWLKLRNMLGASLDRRKWLQFHAAVTGYSPFQWQIWFHLADSGDPNVRSNKLLVAGVRTGKTVCARSEQEMLHIVMPGFDHIMVAPTYSQVREVLLRDWLTTMETMAARGYPLLKRMNWSLLRADLHCGGRVFFRSADKIANQRGFEFASVEIDEGDYTRNPLDTLTTLAGRLSAKSPIRQLTVQTTPAEYSGSMIQFWANQRELAASLEDPVQRSRGLRSWYFQRARTLDNPTLPRDFVDGLYTLSKSEWLKEVEGYPVVHRQARVMACYDPAKHLYSRAMGKPFTFNKKTDTYDLGIDWGFHRPSYLWFAPIAGGRAVIFHEFHPEDMPEEKQLEYVWKYCQLLGRDPECAGVDKNDLKQISRLQGMFPRCRVFRDETISEQSRKASVSAWLALLEPLQGEAKLLVADSLAEPTASKRGTIAMFENLAWEWDRIHSRYLDVAEKDGTYDHDFDAGGYWAKHIGVARKKAFQTREIIRGSGSSPDDIAAALGISRR